MQRIRKSFVEKLQFSGDLRKRTAIFLSGGGTNAERLLEFLRSRPNPAWEAVVLVTDRPESRARELGERYAVPVVCHDIREFYRQRGIPRVTIRTREGQVVREEWTDRLREKLALYRIDFGILAGFVPLCNIAADFPCLNVHPGDLTVERDGRRLLVGLHTAPIEAAILAGLPELRSSVIVAQPYTGGGGEMDSGPILGISDPVPIDFRGFSMEAFAAAAARRPAQRPTAGFGDCLEETASLNQELLKENGDWIIFPRVVEDFASGKFRISDGDALSYRTEEQGWIPVKTVVYGSDFSVRPLLR
jgi:folate-dependent phosphoribosylglycinamide formyltransferase PurN